VIAALIDVNAAQSKLVLLEEVTTASGITTAEGVNAASEEVSTTELVSTAYQIKDNKIDLLIQQYEHFSISEDESIDIGFAKFSTIVTSYKALDKNCSCKNYVRKFLRALHRKWRAKLTAIEGSKDLSSLSLDEHIGNLKVHEMIIEKDSHLVGDKREKTKSLVSKAKNESTDDETSTL
ncbi:hypothetical protein Tco_0707960, partial [Tanacetum coccineum]